MITKRMESIGVADLVLCKTASLLCCDGAQVHREHPVPCSTSVRRNLFGCIEDSSAVNELLLRQSAEMAQRAAILWNFDFATERPIPGGRYVWERVGPESPQVRGRTGEKENSRVLDTPSKTKCNSTQPSKLLQTSLKGYMPVLKRKTPNRPVSKKRPPKVRFLAPRECCILNNTGLSERS